MDKQLFRITAVYMIAADMWTILVAERIISAYNLRYATIRAQRSYPYAVSITVEEIT